MNSSTRAARAARRLVAACVALVWPACTVVEVEPVVPMGERAAPPAAPVADEDIRLAVRRELARDWGVPAPPIDVGVQSGVIVLTGTVDDGLAFLRATEAAETVRGVRAVVNLLRVEAPELPDEELAARVRSSLRAASAKGLEDVGISARQGRIRLDGSVESLAQKQDANRLVWSVSGVTRVDDAIQVRPRIRADVEIARDVSRRLEVDALLADEGLRVSVHDGVVALVGEVGSLYEKRRARERARVEGARAVDDSRLSVASTRHDRARRRLRPPPSDPEIAAAVRDALRLDPRVGDAPISVDVEAGVVRLSGVVPSWPARLAAESEAASTVGVWQVDNLIEVRPPAPQGDARLRELVVERLRAHPLAEGDAVDATVTDGQVVLSGTVASRHERLELERAVSAVPDVTGVRNELAVGTQPATLRDDTMLEREIEQELWWDPRVDAGDVEVEVRDGTAVLTGFVDSRQEYDAVVENVLEVAPRGIENRLQRRSPGDG